MSEIEKHDWFTTELGYLQEGNHYNPIFVHASVDL